MVKVKADLILITDKSCNGLHASDSATEPTIVVRYFVLEPTCNGFFSFTNFRFRLAEHLQLCIWSVILLSITVV